jgi:hypothetical protein
VVLKGQLFIDDCETIDSFDYEYCYVSEDGLDQNCIEIGFNNSFEMQEENASEINAQISFYETELITIPEEGVII